MMNSLEKSCSNTFIKDPRRQDVLCGRGRPIREHEGNIRYTKMIHDMRQEYENAPNGRKLDVVRKLIHTIQNDQGRFLHKKGDLWVELEAEKVIVKTSQAFRDLRTEESTATVSKSSNVFKRPFKKFDYNLLKKHAPAGRFASLLNRKRDSTSGETAVKSPPPSSSSSSSSSSSYDSRNDGDDDDAAAAAAAPVHSQPRNTKFSVGTHDVIEDNDSGGDISDTETEDSFPPISNGHNN